MKLVKWTESIMKGVFLRKAGPHGMVSKRERHISQAGHGPIAEGVRRAVNELMQN